MKQKLLVVAFALVTAISCNKQDEAMSVEDVVETQNVEQITAKKEELKAEEEQLIADIKKLEAELEKLNPQSNYSLVTAVSPLDTLFNHYIKVQGSVKTKDDTQIFPEMSGQMTRLYVREGQYIKRGALIATVDDGGLKQQIAQQQVQLDLAKTTFERQKRLWEQNIGSEMQYLEAKNRVEALEKGIASMQQQLRKVNVYAPFSGSVEEVITKQGQVVTPGATPIIRLVGLGSMYVEAEVPENFLPSIQRGTKVLVTLDAIDTEYATTVKRINNTINPASRSFTIETGVPNNPLIKPNLIANLRLNDYSNENAILVPQETVNENSLGEEFVFVVDSVNNENIATVKEVVVETGESTEGGWIEIISGLDADKRVIAEGAKTLADGEEVEVLPYENEIDPKLD